VNLLASYLSFYILYVIINLMLRRYNLMRQYGRLSADPEAAAEAGTELLIEHRNSRAYGQTALALSGFRTGSWRPTFDLLYGHDQTGQPVERQAMRSLTEGLPMPTRFQEVQRFQANAGRHQALIGVDLAAMHDRHSLFAVAHEIGHIVNYNVVTQTVELSLGRPVDKAVTDALEPYAPAVDAMTAYAAANPAFAEEYTAIEAAWQTDSTAAMPFYHQSPDKPYPEITQKHETAYTIASALAEVSAWRAGLGMVENGTVSPGMSTNAMHNWARSAVNTYDTTHESNLHLQTFEHMLAS
jgi:hypothetical protein